VLGRHVEHRDRLPVEQERGHHQQVQTHGLGVAVDLDDPLAHPGGLGREVRVVHGGAEPVGRLGQLPDAREVLEADLVEPPTPIGELGQVGADTRVRRLVWCRQAHGISFSQGVNTCSVARAAPKSDRIVEPPSYAVIERSPFGARDEAAVRA
jgi:hypothetical protein